MMKYYVGIDLGGTNIVAGVVDAQYKIITKSHANTNPKESFGTIVSDLYAVACDAVRQAGLSMVDIEAIGLGTPSCVNPQTRLLVNANNLGWRNVPLLDEMAKHFDRPFYVRNDADCAALGETLAGAAGRYEHALMVTLGTGVGGGIIMNKKIFNGGDRMGAEIGHAKLVYGGIQCTCGKYGCWESYASATALIRQAKDALTEHPDSLLAQLYGGNPDSLDARGVFETAAQGDAVAISVIDQYIAYLAAGLSTLICLFRPEVVIIGGGVSHAGEQLLKPLNEKIYHSTFAAEEIGVPPAIAAQLGSDAGIIGAAMLWGQERS